MKFTLQAVERANKQLLVQEKKTQEKKEKGLAITNYEVVQQAVTVLSELLQNKFYKCKINFIEKCIDSISNNVAV